jgi:hypothetical protein
MQLKTILILLFLANCYQVFSQHPTSIVKTVEGFIVYSSEIVHDSVPQDVIFFPYKMDKNLNLDMNFKHFIEKEPNTIGYFMYFQNMRHSQPHIYRNLENCCDIIDTSTYLIKTRLKTACMAMDKISTYSLAFPSLGDSFDGGTIVSGGIILYEAYKMPDYPQKVKKFSIILDTHTFELSYKDLSSEFGMTIAFLPFVFKK